jgi:predicted DNA-binding transcriptional regulator AlpA
MEVSVMMNRKDDRLIGNAEANVIAGCSDSTRRRDEDKGILPQPKKLGRKSVRWLSDYMAALERLPLAREVAHQQHLERATAAARDAYARLRAAGRKRASPRTPGGRP